jgi:hypothetical protein
VPFYITEASKTENVNAKLSRGLAALRTINSGGKASTGMQRCAGFRVRLEVAQHGFRFAAAGIGLEQQGACKDPFTFPFSTAYSH